MKVITARLLLIVMMISAIMPTLNVVVVYAEDNSVVPLNTSILNIEPSFSEYLVFGGSSYSPNSFSSINYPEITQGFVQLTLDTSNLIADGPIVLYYLFDQNTKIEFTLSPPDRTIPNNPIYEAEYKVYTWDGSIWEIFSVEPTDILVHSGTTNSLVPASTLIERLGDENTTHRIRESQDGIVFGFSANEGFSFVQNDITVHFRLNHNASSFRFVTNGLNDGIVYNFYAEDSIRSGSTSVFTGFNINNIGAIPFTEGRTDQLENNSAINFRNDSYILDYDVEGQQPGYPDVGMAIRFDEPMVLWIDNDQPNNSPASKMDSGLNYSMPVTITMSDNRSSPEFSLIEIELGDILQLTEERVELNIPPGSAVTRPRDSWAQVIDTSENGQNRIEVRLNKLEPGTLFSNLRLETRGINNSAVASAPEISRVARPTSLGTAYTFPRYNFIYEDGAFKVEIDPFAGFSGVYVLTRNGVESQRIELQRGEEPALLDLPNIGIGRESRYQILFQPNVDIGGSGNINLNNMMYSEISNYTPDPSNMVLGTPRNFQILDYNLRPLNSYTNSSLWGTEGILSMTLKWRLGNARDIVDMINASDEGFLSVNYGVNRGLRPEANLGSRFANIEMEIRNVQGELQADYTITHVGQNEAEIGNGVYTIEISNDGFAYVQVELDNILATRTELLSPMESENAEVSFLYPRIYYINMEMLDGRGGLSTFGSITLNDLRRPSVPPVQNFNIVQNSVTTSSFGLNWNVPGREVLEFIENAWYDIESLGEELGLSVNLYISQNESLMKELALLDGYEERRNFSSNFQANNLQDNNSLIFDADPLFALRTDNVVLIENIDIGNYIPFITNSQNFPYTLSIEGIDENQRYYVYVTLVSTYEDDANIDQQESILSELLGLTTVGEPDVPDDTDRVPSPPTVSIRDVGLDTATIYWPYVELHPVESSVSVHYEVIRIRNEQMDNRFLNTSSNLGEFIRILNGDMPNAELIFLQTPPDESGNLEIYNGSSFVPVNPAEYQLIFQQSQLDIIDNTLSSNQIYFYYVRTVRTVDTGDGIHVSHSEWSAQTATTSTLRPPINLDIDLTVDNYDPKTEFMIRFDAPILNLDNLGEEIVFEYSIREEDNDFSNPIRMNSQTLRNSASESPETDHTNFRYKISRLNPNTSYTIRVRMVNILTGDTSPWSNTVTTRTDLDQDIIDEENDLGTWENYYKQELEKLLRNPYWVLEDTNNHFRVVYRPSMFDNLLHETPGSQIVLAQSDKSASTHVYYIPSSMLLGANNQERGFTIIINDVEIIIPPRALDPNNNENFIRISNDISRGDIVDYYIRITVVNRSHTNNINGDASLSDQVDISYEIVGSEMTASSWDTKILEMYIEEIESEAKSSIVRNWILDSLRRGRSFEEMVRRIEEFVEETRLYLIRQTNNSFNRERAFARTIHELDASMIIIYKDNRQGTIVNGYRWGASGWQSITTSDFGDFKGIRSNLPGTFIFAGRTVSVPGLSDTQNAGTAFAIIVKYSLDDVLGQRGHIDLEAVATRNMFVESVGRIGGMEQGGNPVHFLTSKGYFVPAGNLNGNITTQESIYLMMSVYEIKTNTSLDTIVIRNHGATSNIEGIDPRYLPSIRASFEIGLYSNTNMQPNSNITIRQMLEMLTILDLKVSL